MSRTDKILLERRLKVEMAMKELRRVADEVTIQWEDHPDGSHDLLHLRLATGVEITIKSADSEGYSSWLEFDVA